MTTTVTAAIAHEILASLLLIHWHRNRGGQGGHGHPS